MVVNNDFLFDSLDLISNAGFSNNFDILFKNINSYSENSTSYEEKNDHDIFGIMMLQSTLPLKKEFNDSINFLKPIASLKYSPNNTKDLSANDTRLDYGSIFSLNRIGSSDTVEGGRSLSLGIEFEKQNLNSEKLFGLNIANVLKDKKTVRA